MQDREQLTQAFAAYVSSFDLSLRAKGRKPKTRRTYTDAAVKLAWWLVDNGEASDWSGVTKTILEHYMDWFLHKAVRCACGRPQRHVGENCDLGKPYDVGYANNQYRAIQQFWKWYAAEEDAPNPMAGMSPPAIPEKVVPVVANADLAKLVSQCDKGKDFESRRDAAILRLYAATGGRLTEVAQLDIDDVNLETFEALVTGKAGKQRIVKFDANCAQALDRYINRARATHKYATRTKKLWLGVMQREPLTPNGIRQVIERRGIKVGVNVFPHQFRHTFAHRWLDAGGAEGDLMELMGWESPQMLARYGRSARSARARRHYDSVNVLGGM